MERTQKKKNFEIVSDTKHLDIEKTKQILEKNENILYYAYILHDKDVDEEGHKKNPHYHILIKTDNARSFSTVANWFNIPEQYVSKIKGKWVDALQYLTHANKPDKHQYSDDEVVSNYDWSSERDKLIAKNRDKNFLDNIISDIATGKIKEYNYFEFIPPEIYSKNKNKIEAAFKYRADTIKGSNRDISCIYISGNSGTGKTTYAKRLCEKKGYSYFISSGSNDIFDGYAGQDAIILDELRPNCIASISDLLKILDNNTASSARSRYRNKVLECKMIIITSILDIDIFFDKISGHNDEPIIQLKRRCRSNIRFTEDFMYINIYDEGLKDYKRVEKVKNPISYCYPKKSLTVEEEKQLVNELLLKD